MNEENLKPVTFENAKGGPHAQNDMAQRLILKAMAEGITDVKDLRKLAGLKTVAEVYRTMDKMSMRREYHNALAALGVDFMYLVGGIKKVCDGKDSSDKDRLKGYDMLLKSVGMDKYEKMEDSGKSWEEAILALAGEGVAKDMSTDAEGVYEVNAPEIPDDERVKEEEEKKLADSFYG